MIPSKLSVTSTYKQVFFLAKKFNYKTINKLNFYCYTVKISHEFQLKISSLAIRI